MKYKIDLEERFDKKKFSLKKLDYANISSWTKNVIDNSYSKEEISFIIESKKKGTSTKEIAKTLNRPYWGVVDKLRRLKKNLI